MKDQVLKKNIIEVNNLTKTFKIKNGNPLNFRKKEVKKIDVVKNISFSIDEGEVVAYLGPNGAGKSTTIKMLIGILEPSDGIINVNGLIPSKDRKLYSKNIGVVMGNRSQLWWDLPGIESLNLLKHIYNIDTETFNDNLKSAIELLDLEKFINLPVRQLSLGQRMRLEITSALLHNPKILFLDEPTIGLDVMAKENIREYIKKINKNSNTTVLLTTHDMTDVEAVCKRVILIDEGEIFFDGSIDEFKNQFRGKTKLLIDFSSKNTNFVLNGFDYKITNNNSRIEIEFDKNNISSMELISKIEKKITIHEISIVENSVETIIKEYFKKNKENKDVYSI